MPPCIVRRRFCFHVHRSRCNCGSHSLSDSQQRDGLALDILGDSNGRGRLIRHALAARAQRLRAVPIFDLSLCIQRSGVSATRRGHRARHCKFGAQLSTSRKHKSQRRRQPLFHCKKSATSRLSVATFLGVRLLTFSRPATWAQSLRQSPHPIAKTQSRG